MKNFIALISLCLSLSALADVRIEEELYVPGLRPEVVASLVKSGSVIIDHVTSEGFEIYGQKGLARYLDSQKIPYLNTKMINNKVLADYPSHAEITQKLKAAVAKRPGVMKLFSIGKSVKGKELWVVKISDNVEVDEVEPEFKYISSMHGDEITGREMTVFMVEEIAEKYGKDAEITKMVNNTEIFIMPSMNPDGSELRQRGNAKNIDLNRNFPDMISDSTSSSAGRQIENQAVMKFQGERQFALSANFHGGTIVANYPWDSKYDLHPLDGLCKELSEVYADLNPEMRNSSEFSGGITNGAAWYVVRGGMQDWSYVWFNDLQITLEVSHDKWPRYSEIPGFYKSNRDSMFAYMKEVHRGAGFKLGRAGVSGTVRIKSAQKDYGNFAFRNSEFYKVLPEGEYTFSVVEKNGKGQDLIVRVEKNLIRANGNFVSLK